MARTIDLSDDLATPQSPLVNTKSIDTTRPVLYATDLPSKFLPYPEGATISYTPFTHGELLQFNQSKMSRAAKFEFILKGIDSSFPKHLIAYFDFLYIATLRKLSTFDSNKFLLKFGCESCGKKNAITLNNADIEFKDLEIPNLPIIVDSEVGELEFTPFTIGDYLRLSKEGKVEDQLSIYASMIRNKTAAESLEVVTNAQGEFLELLQEIDQLFYFGASDIEVACTSCGHLHRIGGDSLNDLAYPFRRDQSAVREKLRFGV